MYLLTKTIVKKFKRKGFLKKNKYGEKINK